jgi:hypothetical protein
MKKKTKTAWLIAWEASSARRLSQIQGPRILAFLDGRKSAKTVKEIVFGIYLSSKSLNHEEKFSYALCAEGRKIIQPYELSCVKCGLNPWVVARLVEDLEIHKLQVGDFEIKWKQRVFNLAEGRTTNPTSDLVSMQENICRSNRSTE